MRLISRSLIALLAFVLTTHLALAADRGTFGFDLSINADGIFSPTLVWAKIAKIKPGSAAEKAGVQVGDEIIEVAGHVVPGAKASEITPLMKKDVGESLAIKVKRSNGDIAALTMVAQAKAD